MSTSQAAPQVNPERIFDLINAHIQSEALKAAIELDIFTAIGEGKTDAASIAKRCNTAERGARMLCDYLTTLGIITKQNGKYGLAPDAALFLDAHSRAYLGSITKFLLSDELGSSFRDLAAAVRKGGTAAGGGTVVEENPLWVEFARHMAPMMAMPAEAIAKSLDAAAGKKWKVLDIAAGHGLYGIAIAKHNPNAEIHASDWGNVLEVAKENAGRAGVAARYHTIPGDAFTADLGAGYDVVLLTNFLHHFDVPTCEKFLRKISTAMAPGGRCVTVDFIPNEDRVTPTSAARFGIIMLGSTPSGDAYTLSEYQKMFRGAGFRTCEMVPMPIGEQVLVAEK
jgi:2-polyprenyl-3-methyl-5-hydroxy-6-metoxy-1,4-benzoquinol methylase/predicted transcriptional regulator